MYLCDYVHYQTLTNNHSSMTTRISLPAHLAEYLYGKYGNSKDTAIRLPDECDLYHLIYDLLRKRPESAPVDRGNVELYLPSPRESHHLYGKPVETYNYISERQCHHRQEGERDDEARRSRPDRREQARVWHRVRELRLFLPTKYGIESITPEALLKDYQRWKQKLRKSRK